MKNTTQKEALSLVEQLTGISLGQPKEDYTGWKIKSRGGVCGVGIATGKTRLCNVCADAKLQVVWPDGKKTYPCIGGMRKNKSKKTWTIL